MHRCWDTWIDKRPLVQMVQRCKRARLMNRRIYYLRDELSFQTPCTLQPYHLQCDRFNQKLFSKTDGKQLMLKLAQPLVHGAEMRVAETRAVNRALRKAYGIGICSVEEIGSFAGPAPSFRESKKLPPQPVNGKNGGYSGPKVRDRLCQLIRQHQLDANLVKSYAVD